MIRIKLSQLSQAKAGKIQRPEGYADDLLAAGSIAGEHLLLDERDWTRIRSKYKMGTFRGVGDRIAMVALPIAGVIDAVLKTNVKNCGGCQKRRELLNPKEQL